MPDVYIVNPLLQASEIYGLFDGHFGGFLVKADSEGNAGPQTYNATEAEGANLIARALKPHGGDISYRYPLLLTHSYQTGILMWRAFVTHYSLLTIHYSLFTQYLLPINALFTIHSLLVRFTEATAK